MHKKNFIIPICALLFGLGLNHVTAADAAGFFFKDGDRVAILGDSITEPTDSYAVFIEAYTLTRYPKWKLQFRNVGWSGDTSAFSQRQQLANFNRIAAAKGDVRKQLVQQAVQQA